MWDPDVSPSDCPIDVSTSLQSFLEHPFLYFQSEAKKRARTRAVLQAIAIPRRSITKNIKEAQEQYESRLLSLQDSRTKGFLGPLQNSLNTASLLEDVSTKYKQISLSTRTAPSPIVRLDPSPIMVFYPPCLRFQINVHLHFSPFLCYPVCIPDV